MRYMPVCALSLAFQRTFPRVYEHVQDVLRKKGRGTAPKLAWPSWCCFPIGLSYDLLRQRYGYAQNGVEPFLLSALAGFHTHRSVLLLGKEEFRNASAARREELFSAVPQGQLHRMPQPCLYVAYPPANGAVPGGLGSFIYFDYTGPGEEILVFALHLDTYHVEPVCFPLDSGHACMDQLHRDLERMVRAGRPAGVSEAFFARAMRLCRVNLAVLAQQLVRRPEAVLQ